MKKTLLIFIMMIAASLQATAIRNPAAAYCVESGYSYSTEETTKGQIGICKFPDAISCNAWDFLEGNCGLNHSICKSQGLGQRRATGQECDSIDPQTNCLVCILANGSTIEVTKLMESEGRSICGNGRCQWNENAKTCPKDCPQNTDRPIAPSTTLEPPTRPRSKTSAWNDANISDALFYSMILFFGAACYILIYRHYKIKEDKKRNG
jgi:putative hemolysin